jgi:hypothetical protein
MCAIARGCYATRLGDCSGPLNREHFVSKNLLKEFEEAGKLQVTGYPHGNKAGRLLMSVESMSAKVLCERHNSQLSDVDTEGSRFLLAFFDAHTGLIEERFTTDQTWDFDGLLIERWMLKAACGLLASGQAGVGTERIERTHPPLEFLHVLFGLESFPREWEHIQTSRQLQKARLESRPFPWGGGRRMDGQRVIGRRRLFSS